LVIESRPDRDECAADLIVIDPLIRPFFAGSLDRFQPRFFAEKRCLALIGQDMNGIFPFVPGLVNEGVQDFGFIPLPGLLVLLRGKPWVLKKALDK